MLGETEISKEIKLGGHLYETGTGVVNVDSKFEQWNTILVNKFSKILFDHNFII